MGIPEYIVIFVILLIGLTANIFLTRWILRINVIVGRLDKVIRLLEADKAAVFEYGKQVEVRGGLEDKPPTLPVLPNK